MFKTASSTRRTDSRSRLSRNGRLFWHPTDPLGEAKVRGKSTKTNGNALFVCEWKFKNGNYTICGPKGSCKYLEVWATWDMVEWSEDVTGENKWLGYGRHWLNGVGEVMKQAESVATGSVVGVAAVTSIVAKFPKAIASPHFVVAAAGWQALQAAALASRRLTVYSTSYSVRETTYTWENLKILGANTYTGPCESEDAEAATGVCTLDDTGEPKLEFGNGEGGDGKGPPGFNSSKSR